jgi:hypothetical protein
VKGKKRKPGSAPRRARYGRRGTPREWVGGRLTSPFYVLEPEPYRPEVILWLELPDDLIIACEMIDPAGPPVSFAESLRLAMRTPAAGPPRRPARVRVPEQRLAVEIRQVVPEAEIVVAPTPELDAVLRLMHQTMPADDESEPSYFEDGRVSVAAIEKLFAAAAALFRAAPWEIASDGQLLRVDIPGLGVAGACLSIIGALGESLGFILFPSMAAHDRFLDAAETFGMETLQSGAVDLGSSTLSLNFERGADLPAGMHREAAEHGWPIAAANAYPWVQHRDRDGIPRPLIERDVETVTVCAAALAAFSAKHESAFTNASFRPIHESWFGGNGLEVRFTFPCQPETG